MKSDKSVKNIAGRIRSVAEPVVRELGYSLWDVTFEKVGSMHELTVFIDAEEGIGIEDCEKVSHALDPLLDQYDLVPQTYTFYVSSAGLERTLSLPEHFEKFLGHQVEVRLYRAVHGAKQHIGILDAYVSGDITLSGNADLTFEAADIASVRLVYTGEQP